LIEIHAPNLNHPKFQRYHEHLEHSPSSAEQAAIVRLAEKVNLHPTLWITDSSMPLKLRYRFNNEATAVTDKNIPSTNSSWFWERRLERISSIFVNFRAHGFELSVFTRLAGWSLICRTGIVTFRTRLVSR
jgi:hypothetical protein